MPQNKEKLGEWEKTWDKPRLPFTDKPIGATDTDKEISLSLPNDEFSDFCGLVVIPRGKNGKAKG